MYLASCVRIGNQLSYESFKKILDFAKTCLTLGSHIGKTTEDHRGFSGPFSGSGQNREGSNMRFSEELQHITKTVKTEDHFYKSKNTNELKEGRRKKRIYDSACSFDDPTKSRYLANQALAYLTNALTKDTSSCTKNQDLCTYTRALLYRSFKKIINSMVS